MAARCRSGRGLPVSGYGGLLLSAPATLQPPAGARSLALLPNGRLTCCRESPGAGAIALVQGLEDQPGPFVSCVEMAGEPLIGVHAHLQR